MEAIVNIVIIIIFCFIFNRSSSIIIYIHYEVFEYRPDV